MTAPPLRRAAAILIASIAGAALILLIAAAPAPGHAVLLGTDPADGEVLPESPAVVVLTFNESVQVPEGGIRLLDAGAEPLPTGATSVDHTVEIDVPADLPDGTYIVDWRVISADGHPVSGALLFSVGAPSDVVVDVVPDSDSAVVSAVHQTSQVMVYVGILGASGLTLFVLVLLDRGAVTAVRARLHRLAVVLAGVAAVGLVISVLADGARRTGSGPSALVDPGLVGGTLTSATGLAAGLGLTGLALALGLTPRASAAGRGTWPRALTFAGVGLALVSLTLTGHTRTFGPGWLVVSSDVLHVLAGSVWFGGILGLLLTLRTAAVPAGPAARTVTRFSAVAAWVVLALAATGVVLAWRILPDLAALTSTGYGLTLIAKVATVACIVAIAAWNRFRLVPQVARVAEEAAARSRLRRGVTAEAALLVVVLTFTGVLASQSPIEAAEEPASLAVPVSHQEPLGDGMLEVQVSPAAVGENTIELVLTDADGAALQPQDDPQLRVSLPDGFGPLVPAVSYTGPGTYEAVIDIPFSGEWDLEVSVRTSTYENPVVIVPLDVAQ